MEKVCGICRGSKVIELWEQSEVPPLTFGVVEMAPAVTRRTFPCPGCSELPPARIELVDESVKIDKLMVERCSVDIIGQEKMVLVRMLAEKLMDKDFVSFDYETVDGGKNIRLRAYIGLAMKPDLARLTGLIERHRESTAVQFVAELLAEVNDFGLELPLIGKATVAKFARDALRRVFDRCRWPA